MKLIIIDGGPASGKNTLGALLSEQFRKLGNKAMLLDLDTYVERLNPEWIWGDKRQENQDQLRARIHFAQDIEEYLRNDFIVIAIGERFLTSNDLSAFVSTLKVACSVYLYHLSVPLSLRRQRLHDRGPHSLIDLEKDQRDRDEVKAWPGHVYENDNSPGEDALNLFRLIQNEEGRIPQAN
jgi:thymidylate kinase